MQALADGRAAVLVSGQRSRLAELDVPGSPAWLADEALLGQVAARGERYGRLRFDVRSASAVRVGSAEATLAVSVDTRSYEVVRADGSRQVRPAEPGAVVLVVLRWAHGRWLVEQVRPRPS